MGTEKTGTRLALRQYPVSGGLVVDIRKSASISAACYAPDGTKIAAIIRRPDGMTDLWVLEPGGLVGKPIVQKITDARGVAWPTAQTIYFRANKVGGQGGLPFWTVSPTGGGVKGFSGFADPKQITHFSVQTANPIGSMPTVVNPDDANPGVGTSTERVPTGPVTIARPFNDAIVRGVVPIKISAWKDVVAVVIRINDQFTFTTQMPEVEDQSATITYKWDTQQLRSIEPSLSGANLPSRYQKALRYPDGSYTITVLGVKRDPTSDRESLAGTDSIQVTVQNSLPDTSLPANLILRYQYREIDPDEEFIIHGDGTVFGVPTSTAGDLNATFDAKIRRALVEAHPTGKFDLRATLRETVEYPLTFGLNGAKTLPEDGVSALYALSPDGGLEVIPQQRDKIYLPLAQVWTALPSDPVQVGSTWTGDMWVVNDLLSRQGIIVSAHNLLDGAEWIGEHHVVRIRSDYTVEADKYGALALQPIATTPALMPNLQSAATAQYGIIKTNSVQGVRYTWIDYEHGQIIRIEDLLAYTFAPSDIGVPAPPPPVEPETTPDGTMGTTPLRPGTPLRPRGMGAGIYATPVTPPRARLATGYYLVHWTYSTTSEEADTADE